MVGMLDGLVVLGDCFVAVAVGDGYGTSLCEHQYYVEPVVRLRVFIGCFIAHK